MADPTPAPDPAPAPQNDPPADTPPAPTDPKPDDGKGGKDAILADLAAERDKRQGLETKVQELTAAQQSQMDAIAKALGLKSEDTPPDPAKLAEQIAAEQARTREANVQLAVYRLASANDANPDALLDSASFLRSVADLDPTDETKVGEAIKAAVEANSLLKAAKPSVPSPGQAGIGVVGGAPVPTTPQGRLRASIEHDIAANRRT